LVVKLDFHGVIDVVEQHIGGLPAALIADLVWLGCKAVEDSQMMVIEPGG
jgi:hypothetical protein